MLLQATRLHGVPPTMLYTPGQLRRAVSITPETYRHWKKTLEPLRRASGHSPCFSAGDLVAVALIRSLTLDLGIRIGALTPIGEPLFELCNRATWPILERSKLIVDLPGARLELSPELTETLSDRPSITIPLRSIMAELREQLLAESDSREQTSLRFPPLPVGGAPAIARGGRQ
ncbi:hypothetical protein [Thiohalocapsa sp. ML1]|jgi:hypothetical protein|uniref:hypothetical protein n=1 Tax=Thiohalocapsa sp. ML1 TaxID=1431688 RepID=UPI0012E38821|nr:hypothetical protein [Thiohalocapsa sp. ML1]